MLIIYLLAHEDDLIYYKKREDKGKEVEWRRETAWLERNGQSSRQGLLLY